MNKEALLRRRVCDAMKKHASYGQFHKENDVQGGWFIWLMDAVDVGIELVKNERKGSE
jgi:hypothetical protein